MDYTPPSRNDLDFIFVRNDYTPPARTALNFIIGYQDKDYYIDIEEIPAVEFGLSATCSGVNISIPIPAIDFNFSASIASAYNWIKIQGIDAIDFSMSSSIDNIKTFNLSDAQTRFYCVLTGTQNNLDNLNLSISSFQSRRRQSEPTFLSVVVPTVELIEDIYARSDGNIEIYQGYILNGELLLSEKIIETSFDSLRYDQGGKNQTITLSGYGTRTFSAKTVDLSSYNPTYKAISDGKIRYRFAKAHVFLNPGDTAIINDDEFEVQLITYYVTAISQQIEISSI